MARSLPLPARPGALPARSPSKRAPARAAAPAARRAVAPADDLGTVPATPAWWWRLAEALAPPLAEGQAPQRGLWVV